MGLIEPTLQARLRRHEEQRRHISLRFLIGRIEMLLRHASGYTTSTVVPLLSSVLLLALLTRFLPPDEYGRYALSMTVLQVIGGPLFHWIRAIIGRFLVNADLGGRRSNLIATARNFMFGCAVAAVLLTLGLRYSGLVDHSTASLFLAVGAALLIIQSVAGVRLALMFVIVLHLGAAGALQGITVSCLLCLIGDLRRSPFLARGRCSPGWSSEPC